MRTVVSASLRSYARRYVAAVLAVTLGVAFVIVTASISSASKAGILSGLSTSYRGADVVVLGVQPTQADRALTSLRTLGPATVNASAYPSATVAGSQLDDLSIGTVADSSSLRWQQLRAGRFPRSADEALVDASAAQQDRIGVGDRVSLGDGSSSTSVRVVGVARSAGSQLDATLYLTWPGMQRLGDQVIVNDLVVGGTDVGAVRAAGLPKDATAEPIDDYLATQAKALTRGVDVVATMLLLFGAVAFFVSTLVIANTFTVLLAQRLRDFALLRCVGATRRQVMRSVRLEALAVGVGSATLGLGVGLVAGRLLIVLVSHLFSSLTLGGAQVGWQWLVTAWTIGVVVTLVASVFPARRSTRIEPLAALRPLGAVEVRSRAGAVRLASGTVLVVVGCALLALAMLARQPFVMVAGGAASFLGLLLFGPVLVPACIAVAGKVTGRLLGVPGRLAAANAVRNPRRTAATAASLLVGTTLVTGMVVGMATIRASVDHELDVDHPLDVTVSGTRALPSDAARRVAAVEGVSTAVGLAGVTATPVSAGKALDPLTVLAVPSGSDVARGDSDLDRPRAGTAYVSFPVLNVLTDQQHLALTAGGRRVTLRVVPTAGVSEGVVVSTATLRQLAGDTAATRAVWARTDDGADAGHVRTRVADLASGWHADAGGGLKQRAYVHLQLAVMVYSVLALLSVSLLIALFGIANTLGLSVLERGREHALLRALGLTRGQLRGTLAVEAVLLAAVTSVIGVVVGTLYAFVGVRTLLADALGSTSIGISLPLGQLALIVLGATLAGLAAYVLPARRAARTAPAVGLAAE